MALDGLELSMWTRLALNSDPAASASQMLGLKVHVTMTVFKRFIFILSVIVLLICMCVYHAYARCPQKSEEGTGFLELALQIDMNHQMMLETTCHLSRRSASALNS